jgi:hypothetical protein
LILRGIEKGIYGQRTGTRGFYGIPPNGERPKLEQKSKNRNGRISCEPVLRHRLLVNFQAEAEGIDAELVVERLLAAVRP